MSNHAPTASTAAIQSNLVDNINIATSDDLLEPSINSKIESADLPSEPDIDALLDSADEAAVTWVREQNGLAEVIDALANCGRVALDTEFIKRDTYYPRLALVQLNTGNHI